MVAPTVLVLGAGFGGLGVTRKLKKAPVEVVLVDKHDYHTFQPLLYQVATDLLDPEMVGHPIREYVDEQENLDFTQASVTGIDLETRTVTFSDWKPQTYDYLVVGLGARVNFFGMDGPTRTRSPLYTLNHAVQVKQHVLRLFEDANKRSLPLDNGALDVVIVGGGPTGVETAGAMAELFFNVLDRDFHQLDVTHHHARRTRRPPALHVRRRALRVHQGDPRGDGGEHPPGREGRVDHRRFGHPRHRRGPTAATTVWGQACRPAAGRVAVDRPAARPGARGAHAQPGRPPRGVRHRRPGLDHRHQDRHGVAAAGLGRAAVGEHVGKTIDRITRKHKDPEPFKYLDKGTMATIGPGAAVAVIPPHEHLTGRPAFLAWGAVHLALLSGGDSRSAAFTNWGWAMFRHDR